MEGPLPVGQPLHIYHGFCQVIHQHTRIGNDGALRHGVSLGNERMAAREPLLEYGWTFRRMRKLFNPFQLENKPM